MWDAHRDYTRVVIKNLEVTARVGVHPWEKHPERPSRLLINIELFAHRENLKDSYIDYDPIRDAIKSWPSRPHTDLLETLVEELVELCFAQPKVEACRVSVMKPDIFSEAEAVGVEVYRHRPN